MKLREVAGNKWPKEKKIPGQPYSVAYETLVPKIQGYNQCLKELASLEIGEWVKKEK